MSPTSYQTAPPRDGPKKSRREVRSQAPRSDRALVRRKRPDDAGRTSRANSDGREFKQRFREPCGTPSTQFEGRKHAGRYLGYTGCNPGFARRHRAAGAPGQRAPLERLEARRQCDQNRGGEALIKKERRTGKGHHMELYIIRIIGRVCPAGTSAGQGAITKIQAPSSDTVELQITIRLRLA